MYLDYGKKMSILEEKLSMRFDSKNTNNNKSKIIISEITPNTEEEENKMAEQLKQIKKIVYINYNKRDLYLIISIHLFIQYLLLMESSYQILV